MIMPKNESHSVNQTIKQKVYANMLSHKSSISLDIMLNSKEQTIVTKKFKKLKLILKRPKIKIITHSVSPKKISDKIYTYQKTMKQDKTLLYNKKILSEKSKINKNKNNNKCLVIPKNHNSSFSTIKNKKKNNYYDGVNSLMNLLNEIIFQLKKFFFNKIKYYNNAYQKKYINENNSINIFNKKVDTLSLPILSNSKNFLEEIKLENKTIVYKNIINDKSQTNDGYSLDSDSCDKNLNIISKGDIKKLEESDQEENENNNYDKDDQNIKRNYSYDKKDTNYNQNNLILSEIKEELENISHNREIISNKKNIISRESLLFSDGKINIINNSKSGNKGSKNCDKNNREDNSIKQSKKIKQQLTPNTKINKSENLFIDKISFEKIEANNLFENSRNKTKNKNISFWNSITNSTSENINLNNNYGKLHNYNLKECYENTCNTFEETTNFNDNENNPINKISLVEEKNNSNLINGYSEIINNKELNNFNNSINKNENIIEKSGELFFSVNELNESKNQNVLININKIPLYEEEEYEIEINDNNRAYAEYKIIDKSKRLISFLSNNEQNYKNNDYKKIFKAKIPFYAYLNIIRKIFRKKREASINSDKEIEILNNNKKHQVSFSKNSYETFIKKLIIELHKINYKNYITENTIITDNDIKNFENKIKHLKNRTLDLLIKKHYLKSAKDKLRLISENNEKIDEMKCDIYNLFQRLKYKIKNKNDFEIVLTILYKYENITSRDIKITKMIYNKRKTENENDINKINLGSLILPFFYIASFVYNFQN